MKLQVQSISKFVSDKVKNFLGGTKTRMRGAEKKQNMSEFRSKMWVFLKDLEGEMKDWYNGVDMEVQEIVTNAGYEVKNKERRET